MPLRGNGEGNVRQKSDGRWEASVQLFGRRYWVGAKTQAEVRRKLKELQRQHAVGELVPPSRATLGEHLQRWLATGEGDWKPKTHAGYVALCKNYWEPTLGNVRLQHITPSMVALLYERWRDEREIEGGTLLNVHRVLHRALTVAVRWGLIPRNPTDAVDPPKARRRRTAIWSSEQAARFLDVSRDDRLAPLWAVLLGTGCRKIRRSLFPLVVGARRTPSPTPPSNQSLDNLMGSQVRGRPPEVLEPLPHTSRAWVRRWGEGRLPNAGHGDRMGNPRELNLHAVAPGRQRVDQDIWPVPSPDP